MPSKANCVGRAAADVTSLHASHPTKQSFHIYEGPPAFCATVGHNNLFTGD
jgi:hypothetical protein